MGRVTVRSNRLPRIIARLRPAIDDGVDEFAKQLEQQLKQVVWLDTGVVRDTTTAHDAGSLHAEVWCGLNRGRGFYSRFQEWGTVKQAARPRVGPTAHAGEPVYASTMSRAVQRACGA